MGLFRLVPPGEEEEFIEILGVCEAELCLGNLDDEDRIAAVVVLTVLRNFINSAASTNHLLFGVLLVCVFGNAIRVREKMHVCLVWQCVGPKYEHKFHYARFCAPIENA